MANIVIATAGHVDHGKTTLIKALTGIETDTTEEEKRRGLTINLGFAYLDLPNKQRVGIVDVPGHEKFIKNMVAGLPGINLVLLVVDAAEGVMPQTREHLDILTLLGVRNFLIVLTKIDTVDEEMKSLAIADIRAQLQGTILADADIVETDALSGKGISELKDKIAAWTEKISATADHGEARLNIDRVFSVKGFGTIVTGTLLDGTISIGDELTLYPSLKKTRVRTIQIHEQDVKTAGARQRTALNLTNLGVDEVHRGDVLSVSDSLTPTWMLDVKVTCLAGAALPLALWERVRVLVGTKEVMARVVPLGTEAIEPGSEGFAQLRLEEQLVVKEQDHFILRSYSPMRTIAGGEVLDAAPKKHKRFKAAILDSLKTKEAGALDELIEDFLLHKKNAFATLQELLAYTKVPEEPLQDMLQQLVSQQLVLPAGQGYLHQRMYNKLKGQALQILLDYHKKYPLRAGIPSEEFRSRLRGLLAAKESDALLALMLEKGVCKRQGNYVAANNFSIVFTDQQQLLRYQLEQALEASGFVALKKEDFCCGHKNADAVIEALNGKSLIFLTDEYMIAKSYYDKAVMAIDEYLDKESKLTLGDFRTLLGIGRKAALLILDYMDKTGITKRVEDYRVLGPNLRKEK